MADSIVKRANGVKKTRQQTTHSVSLEAQQYASNGKASYLGGLCLAERIFWYIKKLESGNAILYANRQHATQDLRKGCQKGR